MKHFIRLAFRILVVAVVLVSFGITFLYEIKHPALIPVFLAGIVTRGVFGESIKDLFKSSKHYWRYLHAAAWAAGEHQTFKADDCELCLNSRIPIART